MDSVTERSAYVYGPAFLVAATVNDTDSGSVWECQPVVAVILECSLGIATCAQASLGFASAAAALDGQRPLRHLRAGLVSAHPRNHGPDIAAYVSSAAATSRSGSAAVRGLAVACSVVAVRFAGATADLGEVG